MIGKVNTHPNDASLYAFHKRLDISYKIAVIIWHMNRILIIQWHIPKQNSAPCRRPECLTRSKFLPRRAQSIGRGLVDFVPPPLEIGARENNTKKDDH